MHTLTSSTSFDGVAYTRRARRRDQTGWAGRHGCVWGQSPIITSIKSRSTRATTQAGEHADVDERKLTARGDADHHPLFSSLLRGDKRLKIWESRTHDPNATFLSCHVDGCDYNYLDSVALALHKRRHHEHRRWTCDWPGW